MNRLKRVVSLITICLSMFSVLLSIPAAYAAENLIPNGDFEGLPLNQTPPNFTIYNGSAAVSNDYAKSGENSVRIQSTSGDTALNYYVPLELSKTYKISAWVKFIPATDGFLNNISFYLRVAEYSDKYWSNRAQISINNASGYTYMECIVQMTGSVTPTSRINLYGSGMSVNDLYYVDDFSCIEYAAGTEPITLPNIISDNMLLKSGGNTSIWGYTTAYSTSDMVTAQISRDSTVVASSAATVSNGKWKLDFSSIPAGGPYILEISNSGYTRTITNVLAGEVWLFGGQSNMGSGFNRTNPYFDDIMPETDMNNIRYFHCGDLDVNGDLKGYWINGARASVPNFSAIAFPALETIHNQLKVPVGGINNSVGGTAIATWRDKTSANFVSKVAPLANYNINGLMWYQGESDTNNSKFSDDFSTMIGNWRDNWNKPDMPIIFVQLPQSPATIPDWWGNLDQNGKPTRYSIYNYSKVRMYQNESYYNLRDDNVDMITAFDILTESDTLKWYDVTNSIEYSGQDPLHPYNKKPIGERFGKCALNRFYNLNEIVYQGPIFEAIEVEADAAIITFSHIETGLETTDNNAPKYFKISGPDNIFYEADTVEILQNGYQLSVKSSFVSDPRKVYYAYEEQWVDMNEKFSGMDVNLVNSEGLPTAPFMAVYNSPIKIAYDVDGASAPIILDDNNYSAGDNVKLASTLAVTNGNKKAIGWELSPNKTNPLNEYRVNINDAVNDVITLYPVWKIKDGSNMVENGDFENTADLTFMGGRQVSITSATGGVSDSPAFMSITYDSAKQSNVLSITQTGAYHFALTPMHLEKDKTYTFSFDYKLTTTAGIQANIVFYDNLTSVNNMRNHLQGIGTFGSADGWRSFSYTYSTATEALAADAEPENAYIGFFLNSAGSYMVDNISFVCNPAVNDEAATATDITYNNNVYTFNIEKTKALANADIWVALYNENKLLAVKKADYNSNMPVDLPCSITADTAKILTFDSLNEIKPLYTSECLPN